MARYIKRFSEVQWEIIIRRLDNGDLEVRAQRPPAAEPQEALPILANEEELLRSICRHLESTEGPMTD